MIDTEAFIAAKRIQTLDDYGQWATDYDGGVEYIRADLVDAIIAATFDLAEGKCAETLTMFENANPNRPDVMPYIDDACEACGDAILALNTEETRTAILAEAMKSNTLKGQTNE